MKYEFSVLSLMGKLNYYYSTVYILDDIASALNREKAKIKYKNLKTLRELIKYIWHVA